MKRKKSIYSGVRVKRTMAEICRFILLFVIAFLIVVPLLWMVVTSFKTKKELYNFPLEYWPDHPTLENYVAALRGSNFGRYFLNSLVLAVCAPCFTVFFAIMSAYALTKVKFRFSGAFIVFFLMTQMLPASYAAMYLLMARLRMTNSLFTVGLLLMAAGIPFGMIMLRGFLVGIPNSMEESAFMDGCTRLQSFFRIILPLMTSGMFTVFIFQFITVWNDVFTSVLYLSSSSKRTIMSGIYSLIGKFDANWGVVSAATVLALIPIAILFGIMKDMFVEGIVAGAVKE
jgi:multiple sugar transport system permease protein